VGGIPEISKTIKDSVTKTIDANTPLAYNANMIFIETSIFTKEIQKLLPDDEYRKLQQDLMLRPTAGNLIKGSGGLRKIRWKAPGKGKRGGLRIIYYWDSHEKIYMLFHYKKAEKEDLTPAQIRILKKLVKEFLL
jgi:mRNA-degrading endonuclease RelE of RelBE toxin-antitoxin system